MANKMSDPVSELGRVLSGESLERLKDVLVEPDADLQPGEMARIGAALSQLGSTFTLAAKTAVEPMIVGGVGKDGFYSDSGAVFKWRRGGEQVRVDSAEVKRTFPPADYPELYTVSAVKDSISVAV